MAEIQILKESVLFERIAERFVKIGKKAIKDNGRFCVVLSGGTTPVGLYDRLVSDDFSSALDWKKVFFFFGDERDVSPESERSNFRLANLKLFKPLKIGAQQIVRWPTEIINVDEVAVKYEQAIRRFFKLEPAEFPKFDLVMLGIGDDCHTASLFPSSDALKENKRIAVTNWVEKLNTNRLTLTYPVFNNAAHVIFMVTGEAKAGALSEALKKDKNCQRFPAQCIAPGDGKLEWFVDTAAAVQLKGA